MSRRAALLAPLVLVALLTFACADDGDVVTIHTGLDPEPDAEVIAELDTDGDGVVSRDAVEAAPEEAAEEARLEAERAERDAERVAQEAAFQALLADAAAVAASFPGGEVLIGDVRANIVESPVTLMDDPENPTHEQFVSRLTSMIQLRLAGVALAELGFPVDISLTDTEINAQVQAHLEGPFEEFAQQRAIEDDPSIERLATPHCVSALAVTSEADAVAASERVQAGESVADTAADVNLPNLTQSDGAIGCGLPFDLRFSNEMVLALLEIDPGELTEPILLPSAASSTGELWVVLHLDDLQHDQADLSAIGPFAGRVLTQTMSTYEVNVTPALGAWNADNLRVSLPILP